MLIEASLSGITGAVPALNYRTDEDLKAALKELKEKCHGPFGVNLIVNKSNIRLKDQLDACLEYGVNYIITSLGNPGEVIKAAHKHDILVFCDVVDEKYALKVEKLGADALIAVNNKAGGHAGPRPAEELIPLLKATSSLPVISAGGVGTGGGLKKMLDLGACGISMGSPFIAAEESPVSDEYKQACVQYGAEDIVMSTKLSGTPCTVINTPYIIKTGTKQSRFESFLNKNKTLKKYAKMITFYKGMSALKKSAFSHTYKSVWCAGPSIEYVKEVLPVRKIVDGLIHEYGEFISQNPESIK